MATRFDRVENTQTADAVTFSVRELSVLNEIATVVSAASDISDVYSSFSALVAELIGWDEIFVITPTGDGITCQIHVHEGPGVERFQAVG